MLYKSVVLPSNIIIYDILGVKLLKAAHSDQVYQYCTKINILQIELSTFKFSRLPITNLKAQYKIKKAMTDLVCLNNMIYCLIFLKKSYKVV